MKNNKISKEPETYQTVDDSDNCRRGSDSISSLLDDDTIYKCSFCGNDAIYAYIETTFDGVDNSGFCKWKLVERRFLCLDHIKYKPEVITKSYLKQIKLY